MRIALVSEFFYPTLGGVQEHLYSLAREFIKAGHEPSIVTSRIRSANNMDLWWPPGLPREIYKPVGISLPFFMNGSVARMSVGWGLGSKVQRLLSPNNFDIVHLHSPLFGTLPILANHFASVPTVGTFHTSFPGSANLKLFNTLCQRHIDRLSRVIAVSPVSLSSINRFFKMEADIIPNGVDTNYFKPRWEMPNDDRIPEFNDGRVNILFIGRPEPRNGLDTVIRAFFKVYPQEPRARLIVAGGGHQLPKYQAMAQNLPADAIRFLGPVRDERDRLYRTADIHVFGVEKATFSITVLEGMAAGLPVVTTNFEGHRDLGIPDRHFVTTPFGDEDLLANQLLELIRAPERRQELGRAARAHSLSFDWSIVARRVLDVYEEVLEEERA